MPEGLTVHVSKEFEVDHIDPNRFNMRCLPGMFAVEMVPRSEQLSGIYLPGDVKTAMRLDMGVVVASGVKELQPGDVAIVHAYRGMCVSEFGWDEPIARSEVRFYGNNGGPGSQALLDNYEFDEAVFGVMTETIEARGNWLLVKMGKRQDEKGGIKLLWGARDPVCEVLSVGGGASGVSVGDRVVASQNALVPITGYGEDLAFVKVGGVFGVKND